jgi:hypothetical protein
MLTIIYASLLLGWGYYLRKVACQKLLWGVSGLAYIKTVGRFGTFPTTELGRCLTFYAIIAAPQLHMLLFS